MGKETSPVAAIHWPSPPQIFRPKALTITALRLLMKKVNDHRLSWLQKPKEIGRTYTLTFAVVQRVHFLDVEFTKAVSSPQGHVRVVQRSDSRLAILGKRALPIMHQAAVVVIKTHTIYFGMFVLVELNLHTYKINATVLSQRLWF